MHTRARSVCSMQSKSSSLSSGRKLKLSTLRHMHDDEEIRYILEGSGFFDVRGEPVFSSMLPSPPDRQTNGSAYRASNGHMDPFTSRRWRPHHSSSGHLSPILSRRSEYDAHHASLQGNIRSIAVVTPVMVLMKHSDQDEPKWTAHNRSSDTDINPQRLQYLRSIAAA
jgi:1,2-dihydroxy-3-keto-5-methylthiopentene dioxygenase